MDVDYERGSGVANTMGSKKTSKTIFGPLDDYVIVTRLDNSRNKRNFVESMREKFKNSPTPNQTKRGWNKALSGKTLTLSTPHTTTEKRKMDRRSPQEESEAKRDRDVDNDDNDDSFDLSDGEW